MEKQLQAIIDSIFPLDANVMDKARKRQAELAKPPGSLGSLKDLSVQIDREISSPPKSWRRNR